MTCITISPAQIQSLESELASVKRLAEEFEEEVSEQSQGNDLQLIDEQVRSRWHGRRCLSPHVLVGAIGGGVQETKRTDWEEIDNVVAAAREGACYGVGFCEMLDQ